MYIHWTPFFLFSFLFWAGLREYIACSLLGGIIPSQNSGYRVTRLCTYFIVLLCSTCFSTFPRSDLSSSRGIHSDPLHFSPLDPLTPPYLSSDSTSDPASDPESIVVVSAFLPFYFSRSIPSCFRHCRDTLVPSL